MKARYEDYCSMLLQTSPWSMNILLSTTGPSGINISPIRSVLSSSVIEEVLPCRIKASGKALSKACHGLELIIGVEFGISLLDRTGRTCDWLVMCVGRLRHACAVMIARRLPLCYISANYGRVRIVGYSIVSAVRSESLAAVDSPKDHRRGNITRRPVRSPLVTVLLLTMALEIVGPPKRL